MITQVDVSSTWASWHLLVLIHVWFILTDWCKGKSLPETMVFPWNIGVSGSNFALNQSIDWSPHLGVPAMLQKKVYPGLQMGEVGLCHQLKFASSIFQKSMSIPFFHLLKIFGWWIWVEFSESVSLTWVPGVMFCVFLMHTSTILRYFETLQTIGTFA